MVKVKKNMYDNNNYDEAPHTKPRCPRCNLFCNTYIPRNNRHTYKLINQPTLRHRLLVTQLIIPDPLITQSFQCIAG
jgi:hypothetical protein